MGSCFCTKANRSYGSDVFKDLEWSHTAEHINQYVNADTVRSCIERRHYTLTFDKGQKEINSVITNELSKTARSTNFLSKTCIRDQRLSPPVSPSKFTIENPKFSTTISLTSSSSYWRNIGDIMSFDGVNKRICNRYDIGLGMLKAQIQHGADPKALTTHGDRSCLMFAVLAEDFNFVKQLVELGVDVNKTNRFGESALSLALGLKREDIASYLRLSGAVEGVR